MRCRWNMAPETEPVAWKAGNPQLPEAWTALWGFRSSVSLDAEGRKHLQTARDRVKDREKQHYAAWVLDKAGIETMLANRVSMGAGVEPPRFRWCPTPTRFYFVSTIPPWLRPRPIVHNSFRWKIASVHDTYRQSGWKSYPQLSQSI